MKKKFGIVGFGKMGLLHGALVSAKEDTELKAICDKVLFVRKAFKSVIPNVAFYSDYKKMISKENLDAIIITTPTFNHLEVAEYAMERGLAVFCEKPLAMNGKDAERLASLADKNSIPTLVGFSNRFFPTIAEGKKLIEQNIIGGIKKIDAKMYIGDVFEENNGWRYDPKLSGGGCLIDFGIHMIDLLYWYFGEIESVKASAKKLYSKNVEDEVTATVFFQNGLTSSFHTSWSMPNFRKSSPIITIDGESGSLIVTEQTLEIIQKDGTKIVKSYPDLYNGDYIDIAGINYTLEMKTFIDEINGKKQGLDIEHATHIQKVVDAMYKSAESGMKEEVK